MSVRQVPAVQVLRSQSLQHQMPRQVILTSMLLSWPYSCFLDCFLGHTVLGLFVPFPSSILPPSCCLLQRIKRELGGIYSGKAASGPDPRIRQRIQIGMLRPIRMDHTKCLQVAIKTHSFKNVCRCGEKLRAKAGGCRSLAHTRWSWGRGYLRIGK